MATTTKYRIAQVVFDYAFCNEKSRNIGTTRSSAFISHSSGRVVGTTIISECSSVDDTKSIANDNADTMGIDIECMFPMRH